jgi:hypothetical protein
VGGVVRSAMSVAGIFPRSRLADGQKSSPIFVVYPAVRVLVFKQALSLPAVITGTRGIGIGLRPKRALVSCFWEKKSSQTSGSKR